MSGVEEMLVGSRFRLREPIGEGGMGRVWRARDEHLDRDVALKEVLLSDELPAKAREALIARTLREAKAAARLNHPGIVTVHDVVVHDGVPWIVMELLSGTSLAAQVKRDGRLDWERVAVLGAEIADALAHAHAAKVVHRDLKPDNVLVVEGRAVITDFGIARVLDAATRLTSAASVLGTPLYMAPEQFEGGAVDAAADLWSLGATLYHAVEGVPPFSGPGYQAIADAVRTRPPRPTMHAGPLAGPLAALLTRAPAARPTADRTCARLQAIVDVHTGTTLDAGFPPLNRRGPSRRTVVTGGLATVAAAVGVPLALTHAFSGGSAKASADGSLAPLTGTTLLADGAGGVVDLSFSPDGKLMLAVTGDGSVALWDMKTRTLVPWEPPQEGATCAAFSPDGGAVATGTVSNSVRMWQLSTGQETNLDSEDPISDVAHVAFAPDGRRLFVTTWEGAFVVLDTAGAGQVASLVTRGSGSQVGPSLASSPDGRRLALAAPDGLSLWDTTSGLNLARLSGKQTLTAAFSPDGKLIASTSGGSIDLWDAAAFTPLGTVARTGGGAGVEAAIFSRDSATLAGIDSAGAVTLWHTTTRIAFAGSRAVPQASSSETPSETAQYGTVPMAVSPDGTTLATGGTNLTLWPLS